MNWCYYCIFQGVWKNRNGKAIIIISKTKISKNIRTFLNKCSGYVCALCGLICLKVNNFFYDFITFNLRETKRQTRVTVSLYMSYSFSLFSFFSDSYSFSYSILVRVFRYFEAKFPKFYYIILFNLPTSIIGVKTSNPTYNSTTYK